MEKSLRAYREAAKNGTFLSTDIKKDLDTASPIMILKSLTKIIQIKMNLI